MPVVQDAKTVSTTVQSLQKSQVRSIQEEQIRRGGDSRNEKLEALASQVDLMAQVFEEANRLREEQKRLQEERHQDVLRRLSNTRDYIDSEVKRIIDTMKAFQLKFDSELKSMRTEILNQIDTETQGLSDRITAHDDHLKNLDEKIRDESEARATAISDAFAPLQKDISQLSEGLEDERRFRLRKEEAFASQLKESFDDLQKMVLDETESRREADCQLQDNLDRSADRLSKRHLALESSTDHKFQMARSELEVECKQRTQAQDAIVENLSTFIHTFQENIRHG